MRTANNGPSDMEQFSTQIKRTPSGTWTATSPNFPKVGTVEAKTQQGAILKIKDAVDKYVKEGGGTEGSPVTSPTADPGSPANPGHA